MAKRRSTRNAGAPQQRNGNGGNGHAACAHGSLFPNLPPPPSVLSEIRDEVDHQLHFVSVREIATLALETCHGLVHKRYTPNDEVDALVRKIDRVLADAQANIMRKVEDELERVQAKIDATNARIANNAAFVAKIEDVLSNTDTYLRRALDVGKAAAIEDLRKSFAAHAASIPGGRS